MASSRIGLEDMVFHSLFIGSTGAGKTNALLYWLRRLFTDREDVALVLIDLHGDAAIDFLWAVSKTERERVTILDPNYVSFGLNPLSLPQGVELKDWSLPNITIVNTAVLRATGRQRGARCRSDWSTNGSSSRTPRSGP